MKGGTLFSGIGAPELAVPDIDWRWSAEVDPFAIAVLAHHFPEVPNLGDVTQVDWNAVEPVELVVFGSPCQSFSVAGKRLGLDDPRGNLALVALRAIERVRPSWLVFENVPGLFSSFSGSEHEESTVREGPVGGYGNGQEDRDFAAFLSRLRECGYLGCWRVLDAQFAGVPQRRRRVFFVGYLGDWRPAAAVLFEPESLRGDLAPRREAGEGIAPILEVGARTGQSTDDPRAGIGIGEPGDPMFTLQNGKQHGIVGTLAANGGTQRKHGYGMGQQDYESGYAIVADTVRSHPRPGSNSLGNIAFGIDSDCLDRSGEGADGSARADVCIYGDRAAPIDTDGFTQAVALNLRGREGGSQFESDDLAALRGSSGGSSRSYVQTILVRRLTPKECERLQGFPDDFTLIRFNGKKAADGPRYRALGNAMAVPMMRWILGRIAMVNSIL